MADRHPRADGEREVGVAMADRSILEVRLLAQDQRRVVAAEDRAEPDARPGAEANVTDQVRRRRCPGAGAELG